MRPSPLRRVVVAAFLAVGLSACGAADDGATVRDIDGEGRTTGGASGSASVPTPASSETTEP